MKTKLTTISAIILTTLSMISCETIKECLGEKSLTANNHECNATCSSHSNEKIESMSTEANLCNKCGKNSCGSSCKSSPSNGESHKLLKSCSFDSHQQEERFESLKTVFFEKIKSVNELETGYDLVFVEPIEYSLQLIEIINVERQCCSGMTWALVFDPENKATHVQVYGSKEIKEDFKNALIKVGVLN